MDKKMYKCNVKGCLNESKGEPVPRSLHSLPPKSKMKLRRRWLNVLRVPRPINNTFLVCSCHFKVEDFFPSEFLNIG